MDQYLIILVILGIAIFSVAWMPGITKKTGVSYSIFYVVIGFLLYSALPDLLPDPMPEKSQDWILHLTELSVRSFGKGASRFSYLIIGLQG